MAGHIAKLIEQWGVTPDWDMIAVGRDRGWLSPADIVDFAINYWAEEPSRESPSLTALAIADASDGVEVDARLSAFLPSVGGAHEEGCPRYRAALRKWRYCLLRRCQSESREPQELFECVEQVYADVDYPEDMTNIVLYMGPTDGFEPTRHTREECRERLVRLTHEFIAREAEALGVGAGLQV